MKNNLPHSLHHFTLSSISSPRTQQLIGKSITPWKWVILFRCFIKIFSLFHFLRCSLCDLIRKKKNYWKLSRGHMSPSTPMFTIVWARRFSAKQWSLKQIDNFLFAFPPHFSHIHPWKQRKYFFSIQTKNNRPLLHDAVVLHHLCNHPHAKLHITLLPFTLEPRQKVQTSLHIAQDHRLHRSPVSRRCD